MREHVVLEDLYNGDFFGDDVARIATSVTCELPDGRVSLILTGQRHAERAVALANIFIAMQREPSHA